MSSDGNGIEVWLVKILQSMDRDVRVVDQWLKRGRCDILVELISIGFS